MANANTFNALYNMVQSPIPATETIVLAANHTSDTTRANSLLGIDFDFAQGGKWDGTPFRLSVYGRAKVSASENITVSAYLSNASTPNTDLTTFTSDIKVLTTGTMASGAAGTLAFQMSGVFVWNSTSATAGRIAGYSEGSLKSISGTSAVPIGSGAFTIINSGTAISSALSAVTFYVTGLTGTADATSTLTINSFQLDQV